MDALPASRTEARTWSRRGAALLLALIAPLFFVNGLAIEELRGVQMVMDLGHIAYFALAAWLALQISPRLGRGSFLRQALILGAAGVLIGGAIELIQGLTGGDADLSDVMRDLLGVLLTLAFLSPARQRLGAVWRLALQTALAGALLFQFYPPASYAIDRYHARRDFPVLADFETCCEAQRWSRGTIVEDHARHGRHALRIELGTGRYSGDTMKELIGDWQGYRTLCFSLFNPGPGALWITVKIFDRQHIANGEPYNDRFHGRYVLHQGWNDLSIPLEQIAAAPKGRRMDLAHIAQFAFFVMHLPAPRTVYLDDLRLVH